MKKLKYTKKYIFMRGAIYVAAILWLVAAGRLLWDKQAGNGTEDTDRIVTAFNEGAFMDMAASISAYGEYGIVYLSNGTKEEMLKDMAKKIGINNYTIQNTTESNTFSTTLSQSGKYGDVICKIITIENRVEQNVIQAKQYVYANVILNDSIQSAFSYEKIIKDIMNNLDIDTKVYVNLKGEAEGKLNATVKDTLSAQIMKSIQAKTVTENKTEDMYTVYAYTPNIEDYITMGSNKINVNISMHYNEITNATEVNLSTPINSEDY